MEQPTNMKPNAAPTPARKMYRKPQLVEYGRVGDLTKSGYLGSTFEDTTYSSNT